LGKEGKGVVLLLDLIELARKKKSFGVTEVYEGAKKKGSKGRRAGWKDTAGLPSLRDIKKEI